MIPQPTSFDLEKSPLHGRNLIEASAGTGKTFTLAALFVRLILEKGLRVDQILVVTFTEAATEELRDRIRRRLRDCCEVFSEECEQPDPFLEQLRRRSAHRKKDLARLQEALICFDQAAIFTIHGFCQRTLQEKAFESGALFDTELVTDQQNLLREIVDDFWRLHFIEADPEWSDWAQQHGAAPDDLYQFARNFHKFDDPEVIPQGTVYSDPETIYADARLAFNQAADLWRTQQEQISDLLLNSAALNRAKYRVKSVENWIVELDAYFADNALLPAPEKLEKFSGSEIQESVKKGENFPEHPFFVHVEYLCEALELLHQCWRQSIIALHRELLAYLDRELPRRKRRQNIRSFDDLLRDLRQSLNRTGGDYLARTMRMRYPAALIDEFQDTDPVQYAIFRSIYCDASALLFLIGDPKQAIYSFRGADIFAYLQATREIDHHYTLDTNYRSDGPLVKAVHHLFSNHSNPFVFEEIGLTPVSPAPGRENCALVQDGGKSEENALHLWFLPRGEDDKPVAAEAAVPLIAEAVAAEIVRLLHAAGQGRLRIDGRTVRPGDIAVLTRKNAQAALVQQYLRSRGVPSVLHGSESLFASREVEQLRLVLAAVVDPVRESSVRAALGTEIMGFDGEALERLVADEDAWNERIDRFIADHETWARRGFIVMANRMLAREEIRPRLLAYPDGERRLTNLLHGIELLHKAGLEQHLGMEGLLAWLNTQLAEKPAREEYQMRLETDEEAVKLVTVHRSKGLEYPIVFCPFTWDHSKPRSSGSLLFHNPDTQRLTLDLDPEKEGAHYQWSVRENLAENLRLLYVALTRARHRCYLTYGAINQSESSAPAYLLHGADQAGQSALAEYFRAVKQLNDDDMLRHLGQIAAGSEGSLSVSYMPEADDSVWQAPATEQPLMHCRVLKQPIPQDWRIASFSSLVAGQGEERLLPDRDPLVLSDVTAGGEEEPVTGRFDDILFFPRGARPGSCLHEIFEEIDFTEPAANSTRELIDRKLRLFGFDLQWGGAVHDMICRVLEGDLPNDFGTVCLGTLTDKNRMTEMEFHFPAGRVSAPGLRAVFAGGDHHLDAAHGPLFGNLDFVPLRGFIKGYIDLVFVHDGRYYLVDWKSNHLGNHRAHYHPRLLQRAMVKDHYLLQYHLYSVALHRLLRARLPGYNYDQHFGGVYYLFLRGIAPEEIPGAGIYYDRPSRELLTALDAFLREGDPSHAS